MSSRHEDADAARRLYYVAMTRARRSLALMKRATARHPILDGINDSAFLIRRGADAVPEISDCQQVYQCLSLGDVDLSFAGRLANDNPSLSAINELRVGDPVHLEKADDRWVMTNQTGVTVGRLSRRYEPPGDVAFVDGQVFAIVTRLRDDSSEQYQRYLRRPRWEVVVPEFVFKAQ